jgi:hypothetical protein
VTDSGFAGKDPAIFSRLRRHSEVAANRFGSQPVTTGPNMRICGKHVVFLVLVTAALTACGGGGNSTGVAADGNFPPLIEGTPVTTLAAGSAYSFTPKAADPDGDALTFSATGLPSWATLNASTGALTGTPREADVGMTGMITIEVSDSKSVSQLPAFRIEVVSSANVPPPGTNRSPTIAGTPATGATVGQVYSFSPVGDDPDDDSLTFFITNKPRWATFTSATGELRGTPTSNDVGTTSNIVISVSDGNASAALAAFSVTVNTVPPTVNRPPTISGSPATSVTAGTAYSFRPVGGDPDGNTLRFSIQNQPPWASFSTSTGRLSGTPTATSVGNYTGIVITVTDGTASTSLAPFSIQVIATANRAPTIVGNPVKSLIAGLTYNFQPTASDPDGDSLTFRIDNKPAWATFSTSTGKLSGIPLLADIGTFGNIVISVSDGKATTSLPAFSIAVLQATTGSAMIQWTAPTTNTDGSTLTDLAGYRVAYGRASDNLDQSAELTNPSVTSYTIENLTSGQWFFAVYAVNSDGLESDISNIASKTIQ